MEVIAKGNYIGTSPKKARAVANLIRGKKAKEAQIILANLPQGPAKEIKKVLDSAMANAETNFGLDKAGLTLTQIMIDEGPVTKRFRPRSHGRASQILRRTSHIAIVVDGDIKAKVKKVEKIEAKEIGKEETTEESHKIEVERENQTAKISIPNKGGKVNQFFRRKTG